MNHQFPAQLIDHVFIKDGFDKIEQRNNLLVGKRTNNGDFLVAEPQEGGGYRVTRFVSGQIINSCVYDSQLESRYFVAYDRHHHEHPQAHQKHRQSMGARRAISSPEDAIHYVRTNHLPQKDFPEVDGVIAAKVFRQQFKQVLLAVKDLIPAEEQFVYPESKGRDSASPVR